MANGNVSPGLLTLSNVRVSYFYGFQPFVGQPSPQNPNPRPTYTAHFLLPPGHPDLNRVAEKIQEIALLKWKDQAKLMLDSLKAQDKICLHKGDVSKPGKPEYAGLYYVSSNNERRFTIIDGDRSPLVEKDGRPYSGCFVNAIVDIFAQDNKWGKRVNATVTGVQFLRHGEAFTKGAPPAAPEAFGVVTDGVDSAAPAAGADPTGGLLG